MSADQSSFGPALVSNISVDSLDNDSATATAAQLPEQGQAASETALETALETAEEQNLNQNLNPQEDLLQQVEHQEQTETPSEIPSETQQQTQRESPRIGNLLDLTFDATSSPVAAQTVAPHTGGDYSSFEQDANVTVGPTIREAEEYADQMTSEILEQVVAYGALGCILTSGLMRIYKTSMKALNRSPETPLDHIWYRVLNVDVSMSPEHLHEVVDSSHAHLKASLVYLKQVLLVEDKIATTKIFLFLYSLTYIGSWFNGLTLITIIYLALFSVPKLYDSNKSKIDECLSLATRQLSSAIDSVTSKFAGSSKKQN